MTVVMVPSDIPSTGYVGGVAAERLAIGAGGAGSSSTEPSPVHGTAPGTASTAAVASKAAPKVRKPAPGAGAHEAFVDAARAGLARDDAVLLLYPAWRDAGLERLSRRARRALGTDRIAAVSLSLPPLALSFVADQLAFMAPYVPPGLLAGLTTRLADQVLAGAWLGSVARLAHIETGLGHHCASFVPRSGFLVSAAPHEGIRRVSATSTVELDYRPPDPVQVLAAREGEEVGWFQRAFLPALRPSVTKQVSPQPLGRTFWGAKRYTEFVAFSGHPEAFSYIVASMRKWRCRWCREPIAQPTCPFCRMVQPVPAAMPVSRPTDPPGRRSIPVNGYAPTDAPAGGIAIEGVPDTQRLTPEADGPLSA